MERVGGLAGLVSGRRTKWAVLAIWLFLLVLAAPLAGKLGEVQKNDPAQFLPSGSEAFQVMELANAFQPEQTAPAIIVYERTSGITSSDQSRAAADAARLGAVEGVKGQVIGPIPAQDGQALQIVVPIDMSGDGRDKSGDRVDAINEVIGGDRDGLGVHVAGPVAIFADQAKVFEGLDATLLLVTVLVVVVILLITYRSPVLWLLPIITAGVALSSAQAVIYLLAKNTDLTVSGQGAGILTVLVFGASTDYALMLVARYREELRRHEDRHVAMAVALRHAGPAVIASAATVAAGLLCLSVAQMSSTKGLGPVVAIGIVVGLLAMLSLLPALLVICGRWLFWPARPLNGTEQKTPKIWGGLGKMLVRRPTAIWVSTAVALGALSLGVLQLDARGFSADNAFVTQPIGVAAQEVMAKHYDAGQGQPVIVIGNASAAAELGRALSGTDGIAAVSQPAIKDGLVMLQGTLVDQPDSDAATATVKRVRTAVQGVAGADAKTGGTTALNLAVNEASSRDNKVIIPLVLLVVLLILGLLLRAIVAPLMLIATVVLALGAALGLSTLVFKHIFGFEAADTSFPLFVFVFLVALGIDYNIFLMTRIREESQKLGPVQSVLQALNTTGGVIVSAGLVLAGTFAALASLPLVFFAELGFAVALGVLLATMVVQTFLVPALSIRLGRRLWWPSKLSVEPQAEPVRESVLQP